MESGSSRIPMNCRHAIGATQEAHSISYCRLLPPREIAKLCKRKRSLVRAVGMRHPRPKNPVVTRAAETTARTGSSGLFAPFCPLAFLLSACQSGRWLVGAVGIELLKEYSKSHVLTVLRRLRKRNWSQMELSLATSPVTSNIGGE